VFETDLGKIGVMICYDTLFPEVARTMTLKGAEILVAIFNSPMMDAYLHDRYAHLASVRSWENKAFTICCNRVGTQAGWTWLGHSAMASAAGKVLAYSDSDQEDLITTEFHGPQILEERAYLTTFRDRRPDLYGPLVEPLSVDVYDATRSSRATAPSRARDQEDERSPAEVGRGPG
jgi:predicted amidohydrolase